MKTFTFPDTDYYQLAMAFIYIMEDKANTIAGFEGFVRHIKPAVSPKENFYIFEGREDVMNYIEKIKMELQDENLVDEFISIIKDKIPFDGWEDEFRDKFQKLNKEFEFDVVANGTLVFPYMPVFQYKGPIWIGQIIETLITNKYNGATGLRSIKEAVKNNDLELSNIDINYMEHVVYNAGDSYYERYIEDLNTQAEEFKMASEDTIILEAGFRRAPNSEVAYLASKIAINNGWNGTSNTSVRDIVDNKYIGGSMAHAFVMFFETELEAFQTWHKYFPNSTILIDTYDTLNAVDILITNNIKPSDVRIDSGDFFIIAPLVREKLDKNGWEDVGIFLSGDITPDFLKKLKKEKVPFNKVMAGTKYLYNNDIIKRLNAGFVYKIVEVHKEDKILYPEKKAVGKQNPTGLKKITFNEDGECIVYKNSPEGKLDLSKTTQFTPSTTIQFK